MVDFQRHLAKAIVDAESLVSDRGVADAAREHIKLLRTIGDGLPWTLLPYHTIRALNRHPGPAASLAAQWNDVLFVLHVAEQLATSGFIPIITDLTHVLRVGDIVAVSKDGILVLECKNAQIPSRIPRTGRLARQRARGENRANYLRDSQVLEPEGFPRIAIPSPWPNPDWEALTRAVEAATAKRQSIGVEPLGDRDWIVVARANARALRLLEQRFVEDGPTLKRPAFAVHTEIIDDPSLPLVEPPIVYPLPVENRIALIEGRLVVMREVDLAVLEFTANIGGVEVEVRVSDEDEMLPIQIVAKDQEYRMSFRYINAVLFSPIAAHAMRDVIEETARIVLSQGMLMADQEEGVRKEWLATGDSITYATAFRDNEGKVEILYRRSDLTGRTEDDGYVVYSPHADEEG